MSAARRFPPPGANTLRRMFEPAPFALITIAIACVALLERRPKLAISGTAGCLLATVAAEHLFKPLVERRQTFHWWPWFPGRHVGYVTFPSGHVTAAGACAMFAWFVLGPRTRLAVLAFVVPVAVAWAMIALRLHYPADTFAGVLLGPLAVCATVVGTYRLFGRDDAVTDASPSG